MNYELQKHTATELAIAICTPWAELEPLLPKAAKQLSEETEIEGFRKGRAPYEVIKTKFGEFKILEEAARLWIHKHFSQILEEVATREFKEQSFEPVGAPEISVTKLAIGQEAEYRIGLMVLPPIELPDYNAIAQRVLATKRVPETTEQEVNDALEWLRESRAKLVTVRRPAGNGDRVEVDFSTSIGGIPLKNGSSQNHPFILGRGRFLPGFEDQLIGLKAGEEKTFTLEVPQDWRDASVAGKRIAFRVVMNLVQERDVPAWNDEFAKSLGNSSSAAQVAKGVRDGLEAEKEKKERERVRMAMVEAIASRTSAEVPPALIERELEKMVSELESSITGAGLTIADYLAHIKKSTEDLRREWQPDAEKRVKIALVLREIGRKEQIRPSEEEVQQAVDRTLAHRGSREEEAKPVDGERFLEYHTGMARNEKVFQFLESL